jgi:hypothetical protein
MEEVIFNNRLVADAIELFNETKDLPNISIENNSHLFHDLYNKECKLFDLLGKMNDTETELYQNKIKFQSLKSKMDNKLTEIQNEMLSLTTEPMYYNKKSWIILNAKEHLLKQLLAE